MADAPEGKEWPRVYVGLLGTGALLGWFALLWFMFGDVL
jgi:hypothetical protein